MHSIERDFCNHIMHFLNSQVHCFHILTFLRWSFILQCQKLLTKTFFPFKKKAIKLQVYFTTNDILKWLETW